MLSRVKTDCRCITVGLTNDLNMLDFATHVTVGLSVGGSVCPEHVMWQNGCFDLDAVWGGE